MGRLVKTIPIEEPGEPYRKELYKIYSSIVESEIDDNKKRNLLTYVFAWENWSWRVVGISLNALKRLQVNKFSSSKGIRRGHIIDRAKTYEILVSKKVDYEEWWQTFWDNDKTELVTNEENEDKEKKSKIIKIDTNLGYFVSDGLVGFKFRKTVEGEYCKKIWEKHVREF